MEMERLLGLYHEKMINETLFYNEEGDIVVEKEKTSQ